MTTEGGTGSWRNWAGNQRVAGVDVVHPAGADEIAAALVRAGAGRVVGVGQGIPRAQLVVADDGTHQGVLPLEGIDVHDPASVRLP